MSPRENDLFAKLWYGDIIEVTLPKRIYQVYIFSLSRWNEFALVFGVIMSSDAHALFPKFAVPFEFLL